MTKSSSLPKHFVSVQLIVLALKSLHHMLPFLYTVVHLVCPEVKYKSS